MYNDISYYKYLEQSFNNNQCDHSSSYQVSQQNEAYLDEEDIDDQIRVLSPQRELRTNESVANSLYNYIKETDKTASDVVNFTFQQEERRQHSYSEGGQEDI